MKIRATGEKGRNLKTRIKRGFLLCPGPEDPPAPQLPAFKFVTRFEET
ncbi:MAG: hypothetical protein ACLP9S_13800 [Syntrophales bacterium]